MSNSLCLIILLLCCIIHGLALIPPYLSKNLRTFSRSVNSLHLKYQIHENSDSYKFRNLQGKHVINFENLFPGNTDDLLETHDCNNVVQTDESLNLSQSFNFLYLLAPILFILINATPFSLVSTVANAAVEDIFDPANFNPVCHFSDLIYNFLKSVTALVIGKENVAEYAPLISSLLLRIRLEICVIESYFFEAVVPFINQRGLSWVLPLHENIESLLTGSIFAIATNIILLTGTKIISFILIWIDLFTGLPARFIGSSIQKLTGDKDGKINKVGIFEFFSIILQLYGNFVGTIKNGIDALDNFINKYLFLTTVIYVGLKFLNYKFIGSLLPF